MNPSEIVAALTACGVGTCGADDNQAQAGHIISALTTDPYSDNISEESKLIVHTLRGEGFDASEDGTGRGTPLVPVAYRTTGNCGAWPMGEKIDTLTTATDPNSHILAYQCHGSNVGPMGTLRAGNGNETGGVPFMVMAHGQAGAEVIAGQSPTLTCNHEAPILFSRKDHGADAGPLSPTLRAMGHFGSHPNAGGQVAVAYSVHAENSNAMTGSGDAPVASETERARCLDTNGGYAANQGGNVVVQRAVRRLTPRECERLQGFPDDYTLITHRNKPAADGPRYKAIGNSIAIPVLRWIGQGILENDK